MPERDFFNIENFLEILLCKKFLLKSDKINAPFKLHNKIGI